jgi:prepilin-type N-terminal cleavage/methylation domain-containing protein
MSSAMPTSTIHTANARERGFTLVELLVTMAITTVILGATMAAMNDAIKITDAAIQLTDMNNGLRTSMDLVVRDLLQVGQGLPSGNVVLVPSAAGSTAIRMPGPCSVAVPCGATTTYYLGAIGPAGEVLPMLTAVAPGAGAGPPTLSAVIPGPGMGHVVNGQPTDMIVTIAGDSAFEAIRLTALAFNGTNMTVWNGPTISHGANITNGGANDIHAGDLIALTRDSFSALVQVTSVAGQVVTFAAADSLNLNQQGAADGTVKELRATPAADVYVAPNPLPNPAPAPVINTEATRIRMISYYIDATTDPLRPRLMRRINYQAATAVAFDIENFQLSYDLADGVTNPANVRMDAADLGGTGRCAPNACSPDQIRKVNVMLSGRSKTAVKGTQQFLRNRLLTQVSLRSLAFVDRYQ